MMHNSIDLHLIALRKPLYLRICRADFLVLDPGFLTCAGALRTFA